MIYKTILIILLFLSFFEAMQLNNNEINSKEVVTALKLLKRISYFSLVIFLTFLSALRGKIGTDWINYKKIFDTVYLYHSSIKNLYPGLEKGYLFLNKLFTIFTDNYFILQFFVSIFTCFVIFRNFWKKSYSPFFILFIYYASDYFGISFEIVRQGIAIAIVILGLKVIQQRKIIIWCFIILLAMQFHISAIVAFPLYFTTYCSISKRNAILLLVIALIITFFGNTFIRAILIAISDIPLLPSGIIRLINIYLSSKSKHGALIEFNSGYGIIVLYIIYSYIIFLCYKDKNNSKEYYLCNFLINLIIIAMGRNIQIINRCALYYLIAGNGIVVYSLIIKKNTVFYKKLDFVRFIVVFLFISFMTITFILGFSKPRPTGKSNADYYIPYITFFNDTENK